MTKDEFERLFSENIGFKKNSFHPLVWINGDPKIGEGTSIGFFSEVNAKQSEVFIGKNCDVASFVSINAADSHKKCIELQTEIKREKIVIEDHVFIGSHSVIKGGVRVGHHSVIASGTIVDPGIIPPYSLVSGNPMKVKEGYYKK